MRTKAPGVCKEGATPKPTAPELLPSLISWLSSLMSLCRSRDLCFPIDFGSPGRRRHGHVLTEAFGWLRDTCGRLEGQASWNHPYDGPGPRARGGPSHTSPSVASWWYTGLEVKRRQPCANGLPCLSGSLPSCQGLLPQSQFLLKLVSRLSDSRQQTAPGRQPWESGVGAPRGLSRPLTTGEPISIFPAPRVASSPQPYQQPCPGAQQLAGVQTAVCGPSESLCAKHSP